MTPKAGHTFTAGPCEFHTQPYDCRSGNGLDHSIMDDDGVVTFVVPPGPANEEFQKRGHFIAEAFNVAHETGMTPRQLADAYAALRDGSKTAVEAWKAERAELLEALQGLVRFTDSVRVQVGMGKTQLERLEKARAALSKAQKGGV